MTSRELKLLLADIPSRELIIMLIGITFYLGIAGYSIWLAARWLWNLI